ncbi:MULTISPECIES: proline dehydrogenase family protein [unclassified Nocardioides]|uniref:proline dehydrogenase family protein n=1 Tax=unclassified Nocardioides TaxID=2615069 RepID=UPI000ABB66F0|nr:MULTISPECIES: proline dehydrogenase family protein [unclassified Nocardioides]
MRLVVSALPFPPALVRGYVAGVTVRDAIAAVEHLAAERIDATVEHLAPEPADEAQAIAAAQAYRVLLDRIADAGLGPRAEVSVKLGTIGLRLPDGEKIALENARKICRAAVSAGTTVTLDMEEHASVDATLAVLAALRLDFPETGVALQARLRRTESDCRRLAHEGSRVRLCKGSYDASGDVAFTDPGDIDRAFVRCLKILFGGDGHPMVATHDPRLIEITSALASRYGRAPGTYEFQLQYGVRAAEGRRLAASGERVRVAVPYGEHWYDYLVRRVAERPRDLSLFLTSLVSKK